MNERRQMLGIRVGHDDLRGQIVQKGLRERLLCEECDNKILNQEYEQPSRSSWSVLASGGKHFGVSAETGPEPLLGRSLAKVQGLDYACFKLFLLSILWRAGVSTRPEYQEVQLGPHEERLREMLRSGDPGPRTEYPIVLYLLQDEFLALPNPVQQRFGDVRGYRFYLPPRIFLWYLVANHFDTRYLPVTLSKEGEWFGFLLNSSELAEYRWTAELTRMARVADRLLR